MSLSVAKILHRSTIRVPVTGTGTSNFTTFATIAIPAGDLGTDKAVRFKSRLRRTSGSGAANVRVTYGTSDTSTANDSFVRMEGYLAANASASAQNFGFNTTSGGRGGNAATVNSANATNLLLAIAPPNTEVWIIDLVEAELLDGTVAEIADIIAAIEAGRSVTLNHGVFAK